MYWSMGFIHRAKIGWVFFAVIPAEAGMTDSPGSEEPIRAGIPDRLKSS